MGFGTEPGKDRFAIKSSISSQSLGAQGHLAFAAPSRPAVDQFHIAALENGAIDNGPAGIRAHYGPNYYAAFIIDLDGHHIEAVFNERATCDG